MSHTALLADNPAPTAQEVFDALVGYALTMPRRATTKNDGCYYRTPDADQLPCFVGAFLTDDEAARGDAFAGNDTTVTNIAEAGILPERLRPHIALLKAAQEIHDNERVMSLWPHRLRELATQHGLAFTREV